MLTVPRVNVAPPVRLLVKVLLLAACVRAPPNVRLCAPETVDERSSETALVIDSAEALVACSVPPLRVSSPLASPPSLAVALPS